MKCCGKLRNASKLFVRCLCVSIPTRETKSLCWKLQFRNPCLEFPPGCPQTQLGCFLARDPVGLRCFYLYWSCSRKHNPCSLFPTTFTHSLLTFHSDRTIRIEHHQPRMFSKMENFKLEAHTMASRRKINHLELFWRKHHFEIGVASNHTVINLFDCLTIWLLIFRWFMSTFSTLSSELF